LATLDVRTGAFRYFPLPKIGEEQGSWPHTLRFDSEGRIWFSTTKSNHLTLFDPSTEQFTYYPLPPADPAEVGLSIPTTYGCDIGPDDSIWYSQLHGQRIGRLIPETETLEDWRPPFFGPRRLHAGGDGIVWVPGYASGVLGRFDPAIERWKVYELPTGLAGPPGFGVSETPYALNVNRENGEVWITGSNSDTLIRFEPASARFTAFPLPSASSYTREVEFDADNNIWTCTSNAPPAAAEPGRGKFVKIELPPIEAVCGDGQLGAGEACDDGNDDDCDGCTTRCTLVRGCGDGAVCGAEACDDGNEDDCDGCSSSCGIELGLLCGDATINASCGEQCDPPEEGVCTTRCTIPEFCGNGVREDAEECDDGNTEECDSCTNRCTVVRGCGDGVVCGTEACDDGNTGACDGCLPSCEIETGHICGDGVLRADCGEECDPPSDAAPVCSYLCRAGPAPELGTHHLSFGGSTFSSALGTGVALGTLEGEFDLVGGAPGADGITSLSVAEPFHYQAAILGGAFGQMCFKISSCSGFVDCNGGSAVGVEVEQDSAGPGKQGNPVTTTTGLDGDGGPGAIELSCAQAFFQIPGGAGDDCLAQSYPPEETIVYTTGKTEGHFLNADARIGTGRISFSGENFSCQDWRTEDGPGKLAASFLLEDDPQAGDTANVVVIDD
jgi:cysteine-rich repeat protein